MPFLNCSQGHVRKTCSKKTGLLTGSDSLDSFGRSGFPSLSYPGEKNMALSHFIFILSMNPCRHCQIMPDVAVHYQLDHHFRKQIL